MAGLPGLPRSLTEAMADLRRARLALGEDGTTRRSVPCEILRAWVCAGCSILNTFTDQFCSDSIRK